MLKAFPMVVIIGLTLGLITAFIWKMIYFPEPLLPVILELIFIVTMAWLAIWCITKLKRRYKCQQL